MKNRKVIKKFFKQNKSLFWILVILFFFPIVIGLIYALPLPQVVAVESGDLLAYYGTAFGILGSFATYRYEVNKNKKEKIKELKPVFIVDVKRTDTENNVFNVDIVNRSQQTLSFLHLYDEFVSALFEGHYSFKVTYNKTIEEVEDLKPDYNITMDSEIIDADGFPKYVQLLCDDSEGNAWNCCYYKIKDCNKVYYYPRDFEII